MLAPEVWAFDPPRNSLKVREGSLDSCADIDSVVKNHHFNHLVSVVLPDTPQVPHDIVESLSSDNEYYKVNSISAHEFIDQEFINAFVKSGHLSILSIDSCVDLDNCLSIIDGKLILSLDKESYQELGLEGKAIPSKNKNHLRFVVVLDITASHFQPGKKNYERAYDCLKNCLQSFTVILSWEPQDEKICPSSVASYLSERGLNIEVCKPKFYQRLNFNVATPLLYPPDKQCSIEEMLEWLGAFSLNAKSSENEFLSSYQGPEETVECGQVAYLNWTGFFTRLQINRLFQSLREYFNDRDTIPWISIYVQGFSDVPVGWNFKPHNFYSDGDNSYTIVMKPKNAFVLTSYSSNNKLIK
ncbi:ribonuclease P protein subunit p40-like isoform X2 [Thrips palmi]|uniref:Ribonuclease P protein subunit p40-like isoform X2 n=1 Tax=Thrips palmi TaxID=161013 RepID=A0A6P8XV91_THRPL|nr:ribonuclease P protein subunit p40-like isoform X2 [Thrips palmi]